MRCIQFDNMKYFYYSLLFIPITFVVNKFVQSMIISCAIIVVSCAALYLAILLFTKDEVFFDVYDRVYGKAMAVVKGRRAS